MTFLATEYSVSLNPTPVFPLECGYPPQNYLFSGTPVPTLPQSYGIGCHRGGTNYPTIA